MSLKGFILTVSGKVHADWIDVNGHMNIMWYTHLFNEGNFVLMERIGITNKLVDQGHPTMIGSRLLVEHRDSLFSDDPFEVWSGFITVAKGYLTVTHRIFKENKLKASCSLRARAYIPRERLTGEFSEETMQAAKKFLIVGLKDPFSN